MNKDITEKIKERRKFPRIQDSIFIFFQSIEDEVSSFEAITKDISQAGLMFRTANFIPERSKLRLEVCQPLNYPKDTLLSIPAKVRIVWSKKIQENDEYLVGAKIIKMDEKNQNKLINYINIRLKTK